MAKPNQSITHERLLELLNYNPDTGVFVRRISTGYRGCHRAGEVAGWLDPSVGYFRVSLDKQFYWCQRLAWFYVHGVWPDGDVDHIDGNRQNNSIKNLRSVSRTMNLQNSMTVSARCKSGARGVIFDADRNKYRVSISVANKNVHVGRFDSIESAKAAYREAKARLHPGWCQQ